MHKTISAVRMMFGLETADYSMIDVFPSVREGLSLHGRKLVLQDTHAVAVRAVRRTLHTF